MKYTRKKKRQSNKRQSNKRQSNKRQSNKRQYKSKRKYNKSKRKYNKNKYGGGEDTKVEKKYYPICIPLNNSFEIEPNSINQSHIDIFKEAYKNSPYIQKLVNKGLLNFSLDDFENNIHLFDSNLRSEIIKLISEIKYNDKYPNYPKYETSQYKTMKPVSVRGGSDRSRSPSPSPRPNISFNTIKKNLTPLQFIFPLIAFNILIITYYPNSVTLGVITAVELAAATKAYYTTQSNVRVVPTRISEAREGQPIFPHPEIMDEWEGDPENPKWYIEYPLIKKYDEEWEIWKLKDYEMIAMLERCIIGVLLIPNDNTLPISICIKLSSSKEAMNDYKYESKIYQNFKRLNASYIMKYYGEQEVHPTWRGNSTIKVDKLPEFDLKIAELCPYHNKARLKFTSMYNNYYYLFIMEWDKNLLSARKFFNYFFGGEKGYADFKRFDEQTHIIQRIHESVFYVMGRLNTEFNFYNGDLHDDNIMLEEKGDQMRVVCYDFDFSGFVGNENNKYEKLKLFECFQLDISPSNTDRTPQEHPYYENLRTGERTNYKPLDQKLAENINYLFFWDIYRFSMAFACRYVDEIPNSYGKSLFEFSKANFKDIWAENRDIKINLNDLIQYFNSQNGINIINTNRIYFKPHVIRIYNYLVEKSLRDKPSSINLLL